MKKLVLSAALLVTSSLAMISCNNGAYDTNPMTNNSNIPVPSTGQVFNWTGTDPLSGKIDGNPYQASSATHTEFNNMTIIQGTNGSKSITITIPQNTAAGTVVTLTGNNSAMLMESVADIYSTSVPGGGGSVKVIENDATHIKGLFVATCKSAATGTLRVIGEGYFNVNK